MNKTYLLENNAYFIVFNGVFKYMYYELCYSQH